MSPQERQAEYKRAYNERHKLNKPPHPCAICGTLTEATRKYCCEECKKAGAKIKLAEREAKLKEFDDILKAKKKEPPKKIQSGWNLDGKDAMRISAEAKAVELSYGKYVEYIKAGTFGGMPYIERVLRDMGITDGLQRIATAKPPHKHKRIALDKLD